MYRVSERERMYANKSQHDAAIAHNSIHTFSLFW